MAVENYSGGVLDLVRTTTNTPDGMSDVVEAAETAINAIDDDLADLLAQREDLVDTHEMYVGLYKRLFREELRTARQVQQIATVRRVAAATETIRRRVLEIMEEMKDRGVVVGDSTIVSILEQDFDELPWKNPNAVIATILRRSDKWEKNQDGVYISTNVEEEDNPEK